MQSKALPKVKSESADDSADRGQPYCRWGCSWDTPSLRVKARQTESTSHVDSLIRPRDVESLNTDCRLGSRFV